MNNRITAGELRALGLPVPDSIPDEAGVDRSTISWSIDGAHEEGDRVVVAATLHINVPFEWIHIRFVV